MQQPTPAGVTLTIIVEDPASKEETGRRLILLNPLEDADDLQLLAGLGPIISFDL